MSDMTGDPWMDAWLKWRRAVEDNPSATTADLDAYARELKRGLPERAPSVPAALFIQGEIARLRVDPRITRSVATALWLPR
ncbi:MAG: hypothetical protein ACRDRA_04625 [Pseudonocardiaceae bacterium]